MYPKLPAHPLVLTCTTRGTYSCVDSRKLWPIKKQIPNSTEPGRYKHYSACSNPFFQLERIVRFLPPNTIFEYSKASNKQREIPRIYFQAIRDASRRSILTALLFCTKNSIYRTIYSVESLAFHRALIINFYDDTKKEV